MAAGEEASMGDDEAWSVGLFDAHCHPTDTMSSIQDIPTMNVNALTIMATRAQDQDLVAEVADAHGLTSDQDAAQTSKDSNDNWRRLVPSFGWHPWFSYQLLDDTCRESSEPLSEDERLTHYRNVLTPSQEDEQFLRQLPEPRLLSHFLAETRERLERFPLALIGEVGLDRAFRLPEAWLPGQADSRDPSLTAGGREGRRLSPHKVAQDHQIAVLLAQLRLAGEMQRAASVHGVQAHGVLYETLRKMWKGHERKVLSKTEKKRRKSVDNAHDAEQDEPDARTLPMKSSGPYPPRVCLHSYSGPPEFLSQYLNPAVPVEFFFSFSIVINFSSSAAAKTEEVIKALSADRILIESDMHIAGANMSNNLHSIFHKICALKGWTEQDGRATLAKNWKRFIFGDASG